MEYRRGTKVGVTIKGDVIRDYGDNFIVETDFGTKIQVYKKDHDVNIVFVSEPVEQFKAPGIVVQHENGRVFTIIDDSNVYSHDDKCVYKINQFVEYPAWPITSQKYKRLA